MHREGGGIVYLFHDGIISDLFAFSTTTGFQSSPWKIAYSLTDGNIVLSGEPSNAAISIVTNNPLSGFGGKTLHVVGSISSGKNNAYIVLSRAITTASTLTASYDAVGAVIQTYGTSETSFHAQLQIPTDFNPYLMITNQEYFGSPNYPRILTINEVYIE